MKYYVNKLAHILLRTKQPAKQVGRYTKSLFRGF